MMDAHPPEGASGVEAEELARLLPAPSAPEVSDHRLRELRGVVIGEIRAQQPRRRRRLIVAAVALGAAAAALFAGVTLGTGSGSHRPPPKLLQVTPLDGSPIPSPTPYPTNAAGQTYGGAQPEAMAEADLQSVVADRGENGYCWASDLDGPMYTSQNLEEAVWMATPVSRQRRAIPVYAADGVTQVGVFADVSVPQPPVWLFDQMKAMASNGGDASAWAWWTLTTAETAALATGSSTAGITDLERPVYFAVILGDFTHWLWSLPEGTSAPEYSWIYEVIDAGSHEVDITGASAKPFQAAEKLELNLVGLRDRVKM